MSLVQLDAFIVFHENLLIFLAHQADRQRIERVLVETNELSGDAEQIFSIAFNLIIEDIQL